MAAPRPLPRPALILFDMDGTLLDTLTDIAGSMNAVLRAHGHPPHPEAAYRHFVGNGIRRLVARALPAQLGTEASEQDLDALVAEMRADYARRWPEHSAPYAGIPALLDALVAAGVPLGILSNKPDDLTQAMAQRYLSAWPFVAVRGHRPPAPRKPDPQVALELAHQAGVDAAACWFVGDTWVDMETARRAGMTGLGVTWGFRDAEELRRAGARRLVDRPQELVALLPAD